MRALWISFAFLLIGCSTENNGGSEAAKRAIDSFYAGNLQEFKNYLDSSSVVVIDTLFQSDSLKFTNSYVLSSLVEDSLQEKDDTTFYKCIITVNDTQSDTLRLIVSLVSDVYKVQLDEQILFSLVRREGDICNEIGKALYTKHKHYDASVKWFEQSVHHGNLEAKYYLGKLYRARLKLDEARIFLNDAYEKGNEDAGIELSHVYTFMGQREEGIDLLKELAAKGNSDAMVWLGDTYDIYFADFGYNPPKDAKPLSSFNWYKMAAERGNASGMYNLGVIYDLGKFRSVNYDSAYYWYMKAAQLNDPMSMIEIGKFLIEGKGVKKNFDEGWSWLEKATNFNKALAYYTMGEIYEMGIGTKADKRRAIEYYKLAKAAGSLAVDIKIKELNRELAGKDHSS
jgi:TPR repeat protein